MKVTCARCPRDATYIAVREIVPLCAEHVAEAEHHHVALTGCDRDFWPYTLTVVEETERVQLYRLTPPGGGEMQSVRLAFLPGYIVLHGDLCPGRVRHDNLGVVSVCGYDRAWFVRATSEHYLCQKFSLGQVFRPDDAARHLRELADDAVSEERAARLRELADDAEGVDARADGDVSNFIERLYAEVDEADACFGYDTPNAALLCAIQRRFRALWLARGVAA